MTYETAVEDKHYKDLNPLSAGYEECEKGHSIGPALRQYYLIHYVVSGRGTFEKDGVTYHLESGDIFIIKPGEVTIYTADSEHPWTYIWLGFSGELATTIDQLPSPVQKINGDAFFNTLQAQKNNSITNEFLAAQLFLLFSELFRHKKTSVNQYARKIKDYIISNYMNDLRVEAIADMVNLDRRYASRLFKQEYGVPISSFIIQYRMEKAKEFLKDGYTISQTAAMTGYADVFNFSKMFKKTYGKSPQAYKKTGQ